MKHSYSAGRTHYVGLLETSFSMRAAIDFMTVACLQLQFSPPPCTNLWSRAISAEERIASPVNDSNHEHDHYEMNCLPSPSSVSLTNEAFGKKASANVGGTKFMFRFKCDVSGCYRGNRLWFCAVGDALRLPLLRKEDTI
jgi:hypothetical protein